MRTRKMQILMKMGRSMTIEAVPRGEFPDDFCPLLLLISAGVLDKKRIVEPIEASKDDLLVVHSEAYLESLKSSPNVAMMVEVPPVAMFPNCLVQKKLLYPFRKQ
ncbi:unnamed protein product, partial [Linum tenue]